MKPKLPKLHLRDLFWLVLVCALAVGWWVDRSRLNELIFWAQYENANGIRIISPHPLPEGSVRNP